MEVNLYNFLRVSVADRLPPTFVKNKSYKYEPEIISLSTIVIRIRLRRMGPTGTEDQEEQTLLQRWKQWFLLLALARHDLSLFTVVDRDAVYFGNVVLFYFILKFSRFRVMFYPIEDYFILNGYRVTLLPLWLHYCLLVLWHSQLRFACVIIVPIDWEFAGGKFIGIYVYVNGLGYQFLAAAIL